MYNCLARRRERDIGTGPGTLRMQYSAVVALGDWTRVFIIAVYCVPVVGALIVGAQCIYNDDVAAGGIRCNDRGCASELGLKFDQDEFSYMTKIKEASYVWPLLLRKRR